MLNLANKSIFPKKKGWGIILEDDKESPRGLLARLLDFTLSNLDVFTYVRERASIEKRGREITLVVGGERVELGKRRIHLVSVGKAAPRMADWACESIGEDLLHTNIIVTTKDTPGPRECSGAELIRAGHPTPDHNSLRAGEEILSLARGMGEADAMLLLLSGGGSALMEVPYPPLSLDDLIETSRILLKTGMSIHEMNVVRKHVSRVKGGRLAAAAYPGLVLTLAVSDVPGDDLSVIASGPTVPDPTTFSDALHLLRDYGVYNEVPVRVRTLLEEGARGRVPETPKPGDKSLSRSRAWVVAKPIDLLLRIKHKAEEEGVRAVILTSSAMGESREVAAFLAGVVRDIVKKYSDLRPPVAVLIAGETSVKVKAGGGWGGRNTELVAWLSRFTSGMPCVDFFSLDTDGIDGTSPAAGAWGDSGLWRQALGKLRELALEMLANNNTYTLLSRLGRLIITGPTGSNLNSITVIVAGDCGEQ